MTFLLANWRTVLAIGLFAIYSAFIFNLGGLSPKAKLAALRAAGESQAAAVKVESQRQADNLERAKNGLTAAIKQAGDNAVDNYRRRHPQRVCDTDGSSAVPREASGDSPDAPPGREYLATDTEFVQACARDAGRLNVWIAWATANQLPVK